MDWYPHHIDAYRRKTRHLSTLEHGAYRLLMDEYMADRRPLPNDDRALAGIVKLPLLEWLIIAPTIRAFFRKRGDFLHHDRCDQELDAQDAKSKRATDKARKAATIRHSKINTLAATSMLGAGNEKPAASEPQTPDMVKMAVLIDQTEYASNSRDLAATSMLGDATRTVETSKDLSSIGTLPLPETPTPTHTSAPRVNGSGLKDAADQFEIFWRAYPRRDGPNPRKPAFQKFAAAIKRGVDPVAIILGAKNYASEVERQGKAGTQFVAQASTWLNQERWADHQTASQPNEPKVGWL
jgi:uncharacterized protein YdaU (DUF1376 family)